MCLRNNFLNKLKSTVSHPIERSSRLGKESDSVVVMSTYHDKNEGMVFNESWRSFLFYLRVSVFYLRKKVYGSLKPKSQC